MKQFGSFRLDAVNETLWREGERVPLPPRPFAVLRYLVENPGRLITHDELLDALWPETYVQPQVLRTYMLDLRKVLADDAAQPRYIQTVPKRGYSFVAEVSDTETAARAAADSFAATPAAIAEIVGRQAELGRLSAHFQRLAGGQRQFVFVTGEPGIGKTALVDVFCRQAGAQQAAVARGQCVEGFGAKEEYYPVMEILGRLCAGSGGEAIRILAKRAPAWTTALGCDPEPATAASPRERMPGDLCAALEELASAKPLVLLFEDLQWADDSTLGLISALARRRAPAKLMVVATCGYRPPLREHAFESLRQDLLMRGLCTELALAPLTRQAVTELIGARLQQSPLPAGLAAFVHQHSEGNPLFAIAILEHLLSQRFLARAAKGEEGWQQRGSFEEMAAGVPGGLAEMIELEIQRLDAADQRLLEAGSLMGVAFPAWAVAAALDEELAGVEECCSRLARRLYFLQSGGQDELPDGSLSEFYVFGHALFREVLYRRQTSARRAHRHSRIAARLAALFAGREDSVAREIAQHHEGAGDWQSAASALRRAARHARARKAGGEAVELLQQALRLAERVPNGETAAVAASIRRELAELGEAELQTSA